MEGSSAALLSLPSVTHFRHPGGSVSPSITSADGDMQEGQILVLQCGSLLPPTVSLWLPPPSELTAHAGGSCPVQTLLHPLVSPSLGLPRWCQLGACGLCLLLLFSSLSFSSSSSPGHEAKGPAWPGMLKQGFPCCCTSCLPCSQASANEVWQEAPAAPAIGFL